MTPRERVKAAINFRKPDRVPVQYYYAPVGYYEHGEKLNDLYSEMEGDFAPFGRIEIPCLPASDFDSEGKYHAFKRDEWGTFWEYRIFGVWGIPKEYPLADKILEYDSLLVKNAIASGADGISFGDDYGTERGLVMSRQLWRNFFYPRLDSLFAPARDAGLAIHFHSCGNIWDLLPDFAELGVTSIWPQLPVFNMKKLAAHCRELGLAIAIHTDRARTMTFGSPNDVRELVLREYEAFKLYDGGGWFYIEADNGFPFTNIEALVRAIRDIRDS